MRPRRRRRGTGVAAKLPQEIIDHIVTFLLDYDTADSDSSSDQRERALSDDEDEYHNDCRADLRSCSLISRAWLAPCRRYLFRTTRITDEDTDGFSETDNEYRKGSKSEAGPFANKLLSFVEFVVASPDVGRCIRKLSLRSIPDIWGGALMTVVQNLPSLHTVEFDATYVTWGSWQERDRDSLTNDSVKRIIFTSIVEDDWDFRRLCYCIHRFPKITSMTVVGCTICQGAVDEYWEEDDEDDFFPPSLALTRLTIIDSAPVVFLEGLLKTDTALRRTLKAFTYLNSTQDHHLERFLDAVEESLESLRVESDGGDDSEEEEQDHHCCA